VVSLEVRSIPVFAAEHPKSKQNDEWQTRDRPDALESDVHSPLDTSNRFPR
jgi:hypothetical protein